MAFIEPTKVIAYFGLRPDTQVADFGAGAGAYAIAMSQAVLPNGKVYAVDVQKELLITLKNKIQAEHIGNIELLWGDVEKLGGSKIADQTIDFVLVSNVLFQTRAGYQIALESKRILQPNGRVAVIDWTDSFNNIGPTPEMIVPANEARKIFESAGFQWENDFPAGDHHYGLIFKKR